MKYYIHDNGARPFLVEVTSTKTIKVYELYGKLKEKTDQVVYKPLFEYKKYDKLFIGKDPSGIKGSAGNTILIKLNLNTYVYIGSTIEQFVTKDEIISYTSPIDNSDVPYPYATGTEFTYLLAERVHIPNKTLNDPYAVHYGFVKSKPYKSKVLAKRLFN